MKKGKVAKDVSIVGCVTATGYDDDGRVNAIVISTDKEDYIVELNMLGKELLEMEGEEIDLKGRLTVDADGNKRISVRSYEFIDDAYDEDNDEDYGENYGDDDYDEDYDQDYDDDDF